MATFEATFPAKCMTDALALIQPGTAPIDPIVMPRLVESRGRVNLVAVGNQAYLVPQRLGPFDHIEIPRSQAFAASILSAAAHKELFAVT